MGKEKVKGTRPNGVYQINQRTGELSYKGQYGGTARNPERGRQALQNTIRTSGARQAARARQAGL